MAKCAYIPDGYTRDDGFIAETDFYPAVRFTYRPPQHIESVAIQQKVAEAADRSASEGEKLAAKEVAAKLVSWDVKCPDGKVVDISQKAVEHLETHLFARLFKIVILWAQNDPIEPLDASERDEAATKN